jgi:hypothetical protein
LPNYRQIKSLIGKKTVIAQATLRIENKKYFFNRSNRWNFSGKIKALIAVALVVVILVSIFAFLPRGNQIPTPSNTDPVASPYVNTPSPTNTTQSTSGNPFEILQSVIIQIMPLLDPDPIAPGTIESAQPMNSTTWKQVAANAWRYFQPGTGVDSTTGLPGSGNYCSFFTDWDLGGYIQAVIDAQKIGVIGTDGLWNSSMRLEKIVSFLENRELNITTHYPFWFYQAGDGKNHKEMSDKAAEAVNTVDTGRLFVALNNLRNFNSSLATRINNIVLNGQLYNRSNYAALVPSVKADCMTSTSIYTYYYASGFASFWPTELGDAPNRILNNIFSAGNVTTNEGISLPVSTILGDPLLGSVFEVSNNSQLMALTRQVYLAHEAYFNSTGIYRAFGEGACLTNNWAYEWVVLPDKRTWVIQDEKFNNFVISPIIYTKIAIGFYALYNTTYSRNMCIFLEQGLPDPGKGYGDGVDESGNMLAGIGSNSNGLIIGAAKYAITKSS